MVRISNIWIYNNKQQFLDKLDFANKFTQLLNPLQNKCYTKTDGTVIWRQKQKDRYVLVHAVGTYEKGWTCCNKWCPYLWATQIKYGHITFEKLSRPITQWIEYSYASLQIIILKGKFYLKIKDKLGKTLRLPIQTEEGKRLDFAVRDLMSDFFLVKNLWEEGKLDKEILNLSQYKHLNRKFKIKNFDEGIEFEK